MAEIQPPLPITSCRGGQNDTDSPITLMPDQVMTALNVEWVVSPVADRRKGCQPLNIIGAGFGGLAAMDHLSEWAPTGDSTDTELWAIAGTAGGATAIVRRLQPSLGGAWSGVTPTDTLSTTLTGAFGLLGLYRIQQQASRGAIALNFFAYPSNMDRLHVWDGTTLRRAGLAAPIAAPTVVDTGGGTYATLRYFRVRFAAVSGATILRRSEPSPSIAFTPSGAGAGALLTRPGLVNEGENVWELEASADNANFYLLIRLPIGSTTYTDTTASPLTYATLGALSEAIGDYLPFSSVAYLTVDSDRLIGAGHQTDPTRMSSVYWSPVFNDPGVGNNERLPLRINNTLNLDNGDGGPITGVSAAVNGIWYVFKWGRIYQMVRTGDITRAYEVHTLSTTQGALPGSVINAHDESGNPCVYFLDPFVGPCRIVGGILQVIHGLRTTWARVNVDATTIITHGVFYPSSQQVHWWVAADGGNLPSLKLVLHVQYMRFAPDGRLYGSWALADGLIAAAYCSTMVTEPVTVGGLNGLSYRPFIGLVTPFFVQRCDVGDIDHLTDYTPLLITRPQLLPTVMEQWGVLSGTLVAGANATRTLKVQVIKDMGIETNPAVAVSVPLVAAGAETIVVRDMDDLVISEMRMVQVKVTE